MGTTILGSARTRIPWPLMHRYEANVRLVFDKSLSSVPVMNVPVDDQNFLCIVFSPRIVRRDGHIAEETESHSAIPERVVSGGSYCAE